MSWEQICRTRPRARVHHRCDHCQCAIPPGEVYDRVVGRFEGDFVSSKAHLDCEEMFQNRLADLGEYSAPYLVEDEWDRGELDSYRGRWPHVVTRIELTWAIAPMRWKRANA